MSSEALKTTATGNWGLLRAGIQLGGGLEIPTLPTDVSTVAGQVRLAIGPNEEPRVLLPLADRESPTTIHGGIALSITVSSFNHKGRILRFLDLICLSADLETVFGEVVDEMLVRIARGVGCVDAARSTIEDFRSLLVRAGRAEVDKGRIAGLIAELLVLNRLLDRSSSAWRTWSGPAGQRHDFRAGDTSLEVKASLRPSTSSCHHQRSRATRSANRWHPAPPAYCPRAREQRDALRIQPGAKRDVERPTNPRDSASCWPPWVAVTLMPKTGTSTGSGPNPSISTRSDRAFLGSRSPC